MKKYFVAAAFVVMAATSAYAQPKEDKAPAPAATAEVPAELKAYVTSHANASTPTTYNGKIMMGHRLDGEIVWSALPGFPAYRWTNLNGQQVVVEKKTNFVVGVF